MAEARSLVFPGAIGLGARPLTMPGGNAVMVVSAFYAFRLSDGASVLPATWYETVASHAGAQALPDSMVPLPGSELTVLGGVPPVEDRTRPAHVRCGGLALDVVLRRDPDRPGEPFVPGWSAAAWHGDDNPQGRGGPEDDREALIVATDDPVQPVWFGATPFDHPLRLQCVGTPDATSGTGWPSDASPDALYEAHPALWTRSFSPGDPFAFEGLSEASLSGRLPPYRITITSGREDGRFLLESARIHGVAVIPSADMGATFWRAAIDVGDDILGESIQALVAALEDVDQPARDAEHWGRIAVDRWLEPDAAMDDRPLLPKALAAAVVLPFTMAEDDPLKARHDAAEDWMKSEVGMEGENPFGNLAPSEEMALAEQAIDASEKDDAPPDANEIDDIASGLLAASRKRHEEAGFGERSPESQAAPEIRGAQLDAEIERRLSGPYQSPRDRNIVDTVHAHDVEGVDPDDVVTKLADVRQVSPDPAVVWPAMNDEEAPRLGAAFYERLRDGDPQRHLDISGAFVVGGTHGGERRRIAGRRFDGLFAEDTVWDDTVFSGCEFMASSFCRAKFNRCEFRDCRFAESNLSKAELAECTLFDCVFTDLRVVEPTWTDVRLERCIFEDVSLADAAMRDSVFDGGAWTTVVIADGLLMNMTFQSLEMEDVTLTEVMAPQNRFERISMTKVWMTGKGPAGSVFKEVEGDTCGFIGNVRFDQSTFDRVRFAMTGFTNAVFADTSFSPGSRFDRCDFSGAVFANVGMEGIRFVECSMTGSQWSNVKAPNAWFFASLLRGVDFGDTELAEAVFADADLEGTKFLPDKTIGADFKGTVRAGS
ncbi:MAG: pentapeptide repeat-containing protein [Gammaproteobacteria bacterium]|nr:pentapeptide repeat-containing protein [Gammaproteobacteria bacterium]